MAAPPSDRDDDEDGRERARQRERIRLWETFDPQNPAVQILLLSARVDALTKENSAYLNKCMDLDKRVGELEGALKKGAGILIGLTTVGTALGILLAYGKTIFAPWLRP